MGADSSCATNRFSLQPPQTPCRKAHGCGRKLYRGVRSLGSPRTGGLTSRFAEEVGERTREGLQLEGSQHDETRRRRGYLSLATSCGGNRARRCFCMTGKPRGEWGCRGGDSRRVATPGSTRVTARDCGTRSPRQTTVTRPWLETERSASASQNRGWSMGRQ